MSEELNNVTPSRQMSGRRSKPSMDLLVDNQRILGQYIVPRSRPTNNIVKTVKEPSRDCVTTIESMKPAVDDVSVSNHSELSSISSRGKPMVAKIPKMKRVVRVGGENVSPAVAKVAAKGDKIRRAVRAGGENVSPAVAKMVAKAKRVRRLVVDGVSVPSGVPSAVVKGEKLRIVAVKESESPTDVKVKRLALNGAGAAAMATDASYVMVKVRKLEMGASPRKEEDDDLPLAEVFPEFRQRPSPAAPAESPPKRRKVRPTEPAPVSLSPAKSPDVLSLPRIPRKTPPGAAPALAPVSPRLVQEAAPRLEDGGDGDKDGRGRTEAPLARSRCVKEGCTNIALDDPRWDCEFCSADCAVQHTRHLFNDWLAVHGRAAGATVCSR